MNKSITPILITLTGIIIGISIIVSAMSATTSGISNVIKWFGLGLALASFFNPRSGLYIITVEAFFTDYLKKLAVYYGNVSYETITEVMGVVVVATCCCFAGRLVQTLLVKQQRSVLPEYMLYGLFGMYTMLILFIEKDTGMVSAGQRAFNGGVYLGVSGLCLGLLKSQEDVWRLVKVVVFCGLVWAIVCLKQFWFGFSEIEHFYAETGLSSTSSNQMFLGRYGGAESARPFGLGSGLPNYTSIALVFLFAAILTIREGTFMKRLFYFLVALVILASCIASQAKSTIVFAIVVPPLAYFILRPYLGKVTLLASVSLIACLIYYSESLLYSLEDINDRLLTFLHLGDSWSIRTFAPRLEAFIELKDPNNWQMIGGEGILGHSQVVELISRLGFLPALLLLCAWLAVTFAVQHHLSKITKQDGYQAPLIFVSCAMVTVGVMLTGNGMFAQPTALVVAIGIGVFLSLDKFRREEAPRLARVKVAIRSDDTAHPAIGINGVTSTYGR